MGRMRHLLIGTGLVGTLFLGASSVDYYEEALPSTMNPIFSRTMVDFRSHELIFDRLYTRSPITNELESRVVESDEIINNGEMLKVTLKKGIKWHDGKPLTSKDLCFTIKALLDPKTPSSYAKPYRESIKTCTEQDKMTAVIAF
ncbi:MAG: ABC-type transport system substrate-binding protein, partial [Kiritimatiellia bacterium]